MTRRAVLTGLAAGVLARPRPAMAAPAAVPWPRWQAHDNTSRALIGHSLWQRFLDRYLVVVPVGANRVRYGAVTRADRAALGAYIDGLAALAVRRLNRAQQRAVWINLYNALTVRVVLDHYPVASIRDIDISPGLFSDGPWGKKLVVIDGAAVSLDDIEHRILRPIWKDPCLHYAVNCASIGCPNLGPEAYTGFNAERLLGAGAHSYVNDPRGVHFAGDELRVSSLYRWYADDFGGWPDGVFRHLIEHADLRLATALSVRTAIAGDDYDWSLNDTERR